MTGSVGRDLGQVRDAEHLISVGERSQLRADPFGRGSADAGVDLVENQGPARRLERRDGCSERQHCPARQPTGTT